LWVLAAPVRAADLALDLASRSPASPPLLLRATLSPDRAGLTADDFHLELLPDKAPADAVPQKLGFILARLRGAYYLDVRRLPALPRGAYRIRLTVKGSGTAETARPIDLVPPALDVALVIDQSFSMRRTDPDRLRVAAAKTFVDLAASGDRIGSVAVVAFATRSETLIAPTAPTNKKALHQAIDRIDTLGQTDIDSALQLAHAELKKGPSPGKAVVLLTDGRNNPKDYDNAHRTFVRAGWPVYTIGFSDEADVPTLRRIARETGGQAFDTPTSDELREIFTRICFALERQSVVRKTVLQLQPDQQVTEAIPLDDTVTRATFAARSEQKDSLFTLIAPGDAEAASEQSETRGTFKFYIYRNPKPGAWKALLRGGAKPDRVTLETTANTPLFPLLMPLAPQYRAGEPIELAVTLAEGATPLAGVTLAARLTAADGKRVSVPLADQGGGLYAGQIISPIAPGEFTLDVTAAGNTTRGHRFERQVSTAGKVIAPETPELWTSARALDLGSLYTGESGEATLTLRGLLPPDTRLNLAASVRSENLPAEALAVEITEPDDNGLRKLTLRADVPPNQPAGACIADLILTLGPDTRRVLPVRCRVLHPRVIAEPESLTLGPMPAGASATRNLRLRVEPRGQLDVALRLDGPLANPPSRLDKTKLRLGTQVAVVALTLGTPEDAEAGAYRGELAIIGPGSRQSVPLELTVGATALEIGPSELDFGSMQPGQSARRKLSLRLSGPASVEIAAQADFGGRLPAEALDLHRQRRRLEPGQTLEVTATLRIPPDQPVGAVTGRLRFAANKALGSLPVRVTVVPGPTFAVEPGVLQLHGAEIGRVVRQTVAVRSLIHRPQTLKIRPTGGDEAITVEPAEFVLEPDGRSLITVTCIAPLDAPVAVLRRAFTLEGPMLPQSLAVEAKPVPPADGAFVLGEGAIPLGSARPGSEASGAVEVTSTIDLPQMITLVPESTADQAAWARGPSGPVMLPARGTAVIPFDAVIAPGAPAGDRRLRLTLRGPLGERVAEATVAVTAAGAAAGGRGRYPVILLLLLAMAVTAALVFLIVRALLRIPGHRMIKYFAASAVINLGLFILLTQMIAVRKMITEPAIVVRLEDAEALPGMASEASSAGDKPVPVETPARDAQADRRTNEAEDPNRTPADAQQARLEAEQRELEREQARMENAIERSKQNLAKLSTPQIEEVVALAEQMQRRMEEAPERPTDDRKVAEPRVATESEAQKTLEAALALARAARELQTQRDAPAALTPDIERANSQTSIETTQRVENLMAEVREAQRKAESLTEARAELRPDANLRAERTGPQSPANAAPASRPEMPVARQTAIPQHTATPDHPPTPELRTASDETRTPLRAEEALTSEAKPAPRKTLESVAVRSPESEAGSSKAAPTASQPLRSPALLHQAATNTAPQQTATGRAAATAPAPGTPERSTVRVALPDAPPVSIEAEARETTQTTMVQAEAAQPGASEVVAPRAPVDTGEAMSPAAAPLLASARSETSGALTANTARRETATHGTPSLAESTNRDQPSIERPNEALPSEAREPQPRRASAPEGTPTGRTLHGERTQAPDSPAARPLLPATGPAPTAASGGDSSRLTEVIDRLADAAPGRSDSPMRVPVTEAESVAPEVASVGRLVKTSTSAATPGVRATESVRGTTASTPESVSPVTAPTAGSVAAKPSRPGRISTAAWTEATLSDLPQTASGPQAAPRNEDVSVGLGKAAVRLEQQAEATAPSRLAEASKAAAAGEGTPRSATGYDGPEARPAHNTTPSAVRVTARLPGPELPTPDTGAASRLATRRPSETVAAQVSAPVAGRTEPAAPSDTADVAVRGADAERRAEWAAPPDRPRPRVAAQAMPPSRTALPGATRVAAAQPTITPTAARWERLPNAALIGERGMGTVKFALAKYAGDWDCDKTAMPNLAHQLERRVGILLGTETRTVELREAALSRQPFLFISGHKDFRFSDAEVAALRRYLAEGGSLWINDSTDETDERFDRAVRRELARLLPDSTLEKLPTDHHVFRSGYDLSQGFKGYRVPPGDKYRCDYLEGVRTGGRTAVIYTRNDYGDGLEINPTTAPLMPSLTDLSPHDMQEGSVRMGINIALYFLSSRWGEANTERVGQALAAHSARDERDRRVAIENAETTLLDGFDREFSWELERDWGDAADLRAITGPNKSKRMSLRFALGEQRKIVVSRDLLEDTDFSKHNALLMDITSRMPAGCRVAIGLVTMPDWKYYESSPVFVRPGDNPNVLIRLDQPTFKTEAGEWKYNQKVEGLNAVRKVVVLIYPIRAGAIDFDNLRLGRLKGGNTP